MAKLKDIKNSRFVTKDDVEPAIKVTIIGCDEEDVSQDNDPPELKWVLKFKENVKPLVLNVTNFERIAFITGKDDSDDWVGTEITLWNDMTVRFGDKKGGIRVWVQPANTPNTSQPPTTNAEAEAQHEEVCENGPPDEGPPF